MKPRSALAIVAASGLALALAVLAHDEHDAVQVAPFDLDSPRRPSPETAKFIDLQTAEADFGDVEDVIRLSGYARVMPDRIQYVSSGVSGIVARMNVVLGDRVRKGDVIARVDSPDLAKMVYEMHQTEVEHEKAGAEVLAARNTVENLKNQLGANEAQLRIAEDELARLEAGGDAVSANLLASKRTGIVQAKAQITTLRVTHDRSSRTLASLEKIYDSTAKASAAMQSVIDLIHAHPGGGSVDPHSTDEETKGTFLLYAHTDGIIRKRDGIVGQGVQPGQVLAEIADYRQIMIEGELPESLAAVVAGARGASVRIRRAGAQVGEPALTTGTIKGIGPIVDAIKRTGHVIITAENPGASDGQPALLDGAFVSLDVVLRAAKGVVVVPASAVVNDGPMHFVFVKDGDAYVKRDIVPGNRDDRFVEVRDGIVPGDQVVTRGAYALTQLRPTIPHDPHDHDHDHDHGHGHKH